MTSMTNSIKKICITPTAVASGDGYQIKKTSPITNKATKNESNKWLRKKFRRLDILNIRLIFYRHSGGAYFAGNVPNSATKFLVVALVEVVEAHAQSILPEILASFAP